jgi:hypothetical protein
MRHWLTDLGGESTDLLSDWRTGKNTQPSLVALMRQSIFSRLAGYEDTNDAECLSVDPTLTRPLQQRRWCLHIREKSDIGANNGVETPPAPDKIRWRTEK